MIIVKVERKEDVEHGVRMGRAVANAIEQTAKVERIAKICLIVSAALGIALLLASRWLS